MSSSISVALQCDNCGDGGPTLTDANAIQFIKRFTKGGRIKGTAYDTEGWYHSKSGRDYCPPCWPEGTSE